MRRGPAFWPSRPSSATGPTRARGLLANQRSDWYGLVTEIVTAPFAVDIIKGAQDRALVDEKYLLIASTESDPAAETAVIERLLEQRVEGLLYAATWHRAVTIPEIAREVPTVLVNCFDREGRFPAVVPDERAGGRRATERLLAAGHRRIGFVNLDPDIPAAVGRRIGFHETLLEAGIAADENLEISGHATADGGYTAASALLDLADPPTALFCANDRMAMGAYDAIKERGLRIPNDVAVIGFDNQELIAAYLRPGLTTVALPFEHDGRQRRGTPRRHHRGSVDRHGNRDGRLPAPRTRVGLTGHPGPTRSPFGFNGRKEHTHHDSSQESGAHRRRSGGGARRSRSRAAAAAEATPPTAGRQPAAHHPARGHGDVQPQLQPVLEPRVPDDAAGDLRIDAGLQPG